MCKKEKKLKRFFLLSQRTEKKAPIEPYLKHDHILIEHICTAFYMQIVIYLDKNEIMSLLLRQKQNKENKS